MKKAYLSLFAGLLAGWLAAALPAGAQPYASGLKPVTPEAVQPARSGISFDASSSKVLSARLLGNEHFGTPLSAAAFSRARQTRTQSPRHKLPAQPIDIWGNVLSADSWSSSSAPYGYYSFSTEGSTELLELGLGDYLNYNGGGAIYDGLTHGICYMTQGGATYAFYVEYDTDSWEATTRTGQAISDPTMIATSVAYDPVSKLVYGQFYNATQTAYEFGTIDYESLARTSTLSTQTDAWLAMAVNADGQVYAVDQSGNLLSVDKKTGAATVVGNTGVSMGLWQQGMAFDPKTGDLYWAAGNAVDNSTKLYEVNTATGKATYICDVPDNPQFTCMYVPYYYATGAPEAVSLFTFNFANGSTTGTIDFRTAKRSQDGTLLKGDVNYTITANGAKVGEGTAQPDEAVKAPVTLPAGEVKVGVTLSNEAGESPVTELVQWIGYDQPQGVQSLNLTIDKANNNLATLTWQAPDVTGSHDGYVDVDNLTYDVVRYPGAVKVAEGLQATTFTENLPQSETLTAYYYEVIAVNHGTASEAVRSNKATVGTVAEVPYSEDFTDNGCLDAYTIVDTNNDGCTWWWSRAEGRARYETTDASGTADDWLITPPIRLQKDCIYTFSFYIAPGSNYPERFAAGFGKSTDPSTFTMTTEPTDLPVGASGRRVTADVTITESGNYYFGIQALSTLDGYFILADNVSVTLKRNLAAPAAVSQFTVTPDASGARQAVISFVTPTQTEGGTALQNLTKVELYRGETLIKTFDNPALGTTLTYTDNEPADGDNTYEVFAYNEAGRSEHAIATVYVGQDIPLAPKDLTLTDQLGGKGKLTWSSPGNVGEKGNPVNEADLVYNVYSVNAKGEPELLKGNLKTMECDVEIPTTGKQRMVYFAVTAKNSVEESYPAVSNVVLGGDDYKLPFKESFAGGKLTSGLWTADRSGENYFDPTQSASSDADGGAASFQAKNEGDAATLGSGKISLEGAANPWLVYRYYARPGKLAQLKLELSRNGSMTDLVDLKTINYTTLTGEDGWRTVAVDLSPYKDASYIRLLFTAMSEDVQTLVTIDDINVRDALQNDLTARITAPDRVDLGSTANISVEVQNIGLQPAKDYKVHLYANGQLVQTVDGPELASYDLTQVNFAYATATVNADAVKVKAEVEYAVDQDKTNNSTTEASITVRKPRLPIVTDLWAGDAGNGVALAWSKPALEPQKLTDGFENYTSFLTQDFGDWQTANLDGQHCSGWGNVEFPHNREVYSFIVFDPLAAGYDLRDYPNMAAYAGDKFVASMAPYEGWEVPTEPGDHWLISPVLNGKKQTVSLYVKTYSFSTGEGTAYYGLEPFEIWYSTTDTNPESFTQLGQTAEAPLEWTRAEANLPDGAKYFAVRARAGLNSGENCWVFMVDNVSYQTGDFVVSHYNVYRDGVKIGQTQGDELSFTDTGATVSEDHVYNVTTVYTVGESSYSNDALCGPTSINAVNGTQVEVEALTGAVSVSNAKGLSVQVYSLDGKRLHAETASDDQVTIALPAGVYAVKVGTKAVKVVVR